LRECFGAIGPEHHWFDGKTDRQIVRELMRSEGFSDEVIDSRIDEVLFRYVAHLERELCSPVHFPRVLNGVLQLLDALEGHNDILLGVLTGNVAAGAERKLSSVGLDPLRFRVGAYGSDHEHRTALPGIAQARAAEFLGKGVAGSALVVIGDTPADVTCGKEIGARAIGVATGRFKTHELAEHGAAAVFADLTATDDIVGAILDA
jgi:phosphoglycolate phosphatase-like HAD superfamily hydrolase